MYSIEIGDYEKFSWEGVRYLKPVADYSKACANLDKLASVLVGSGVILSDSCPTLRFRIFSSGKIEQTFVGDQREDHEIEMDFYYLNKRKKFVVGRKSGDLSHWTLKGHSEEQRPARSKMRCRNKPKMRRAGK